MKLAEGTAVHVRKLRPNGEQHYAWDGTVVRSDDDGLVLRAEFNVELVQREWATFRRGDIFYEFYYFDRAYNVYQISSADGTLKGWYCNVGLPPTVDAESKQLSYVDLALDLWANPDGTFVVLDQDELDALLEQYPELTSAAEHGRAQLLHLVESGHLPRWAD